MARILILLGLAILVAGLLWPYLSQIGLGRLPGDIVKTARTDKNGNFTVTFTDPKVIQAFRWVQSYSRRLGPAAVAGSCRPRTARSPLSGSDRPYFNQCQLVPVVPFRRWRTGRSCRGSACAGPP